MFIKKIILRINHMKLDFTFHSDMKPCDTKKELATPKNKMI
jgi:hypothetical protein